MPSEFSAELGRNFVNKVSYFFQDNFGFNVGFNAYEGRGGASIVANGERVRFDLIMNQIRTRVHNQERREYNMHFFCECKFRSKPRGLKTELKKFLKKALKASPECQTLCSDNFRFMFVCNHHFGVNQSKLESVEYLKSLLNGNHTEVNLRNLAKRVRILVLEDWFLDAISKGRIKI